MTEHSTKNNRLTSSANETRAATKVRGLVYDLEAEAFKALAHPKRLLVLDLLSDGEERTVTELLERTDMSQSGLSQNLAVLRNSGLVTARRDGNFIYYKIVDPRVIKAISILRTIRAEHLETRQVLLQEVAAEKRVAYRRAAKMGAFFLLAGVSMTAMLMVAHPVLAGGPPTDVVPHARAMMSSGDAAGLLQTCVQLLTQQTP